jgi:transcriptional regulator with XRE-family HTH domain
VHEVVAAKARALMAYHKHATPSEAARYCKVSQQQMDRILKGQRVRVDTLEKLARGYGLEPYQMLIPGLNPADPQVLRSLSPEEQKLYKALQEALDDLRRLGPK